MEYCEQNLNNFTVIFSEQISNHTKANFSSSSSTSSNNSCIDTVVQTGQSNNVNIPISSTESTVSGSSLEQSQNADERKRKRNKRKEEKMILKYKKDEAAQLQVIARSKCGRYIKYDYKIGEGGYKIVSKGFDKETCCAIAWCEVKREHLDSKEKNQSMLKEIEIMLKLDHPNVVKCFAVLKDWWVLRDEANEKKNESRGLVIIQELMGTGTLKEMIKKNFQDGRCILDIRLITRWLYQIVDGLRYMHCRIQPPIIHRDVKSENCFLVEQTCEEFVSVKIGDFGLATTINHNSHRKTMIGTVGFMAPEVYEESYDIKVDIYAFGMMVLEVMTNKTPYDDCTNVFQVVSKSMGSHLPDVISTISQPLIKEMILACVHPVPTFRPSAEELCEHEIFQNTPLIVEPIMNGGQRSDAISSLVHRLNFKMKWPVIDLTICTNRDFIQLNNCRIDFQSVTFSLDVYQAQSCDLSELMEVLNSYLEKEFKTSHKKWNQSKKLSDSIRLQIQYLIKFINGERWRRIFENFLVKENEERRAHRSNSTPDQRNSSPTVERLLQSSSLNIGSVDKFTNNFTEYSHNVAVYHKARESFDEEIENYCLEMKILNKPYFFNFNSQHTKIENSDVLQDVSKHETNDSKLSLEIKELSYQNASGTDIRHGRDDSGIQLSPVTDTVSSNDEVFLSPTRKDKGLIRAEIISAADVTDEEEIVGYQDQECYVGDFIMARDPWTDRYVNSVVDHPQLYNNESERFNAMLHDHGINYDYYQYRQENKPSDPFALHPHPQVNHIYPTPTNFQLGSKSVLNESYIPEIPFYEDESPNPGYLTGYNIPVSYQSSDNLHLPSQQQTAYLLNYSQPHVNSGYPKLRFSSQNPLPPPNFTVPYSTTYHYQTLHTNPDQHVMQSNAPYPVPLDQVTRTPIPTSQPVLTRSLPSIVGSVPTAFDNIIVSAIYQSYVSSASNAIISQASAPITSVGANVTQKQTVMIPNSPQSQLLSQRFNLPVTSSTKSTSTRSQSSYSSLISSSKVLDKSKKKGKLRSKSKYLLKVINIQENTNPSESVLTFEMMIPMYQMRFTCCLSNEFNSLDVSNSVAGETGQIPGELGKKDILESLVNTVKKICQCLTEDIHSIPLNEEYIFHPCGPPSSGLIKLSDYCFSVPVSLESDQNQSTASSLQQFNMSNICTLSRHPSSEDVSGGSEKLLNNFPESDLIVFNENDMAPPLATIPADTANPSIVPSKCTCPMNETSIKVPEYLFITVKQAVDKLLNLHCKGLIILPSSNDILTRTFRVLEIPADHMFVGLPCADSSFNVIKGQKDKDFIIAKDNRDPENVSDKCVYQKPSEGAVVLDSSGEIQYIVKPSLILPSKTGNGQEKCVVKELPQELTHNRDQILDFDQIISVLKSINQTPAGSNTSKEELSFDSPVLLENFPRRGSDDSIASITQSQSQVQFERIYCEYVSMPKTAECSNNHDRDLPRKHVRSRKISNESLDSVSTIPRTAPINPTKSHPMATGLNQRLPYTFSNQNQCTSIPGNMYLQNVPLYPASSNLGPGLGYGHVHSVIPSQFHQNPRIQAGTANMQPLIPVISTPLHHAHVPSLSSSHASDHTNANRHIQLPASVASSQYFDPNVINSKMADNLRIKLLNQSTSGCAQSQSSGTPVLFIPHIAPSTNVTNTSAPGLTANQMKSNATPESTNHNATVQKSDSDAKAAKSEQTIGRFVVRLVTDGSSNS